MPIELNESLRAVVRAILGYEFFTFEDETPLEPDPIYGEQYAQHYNREVGKLAWDISQLLNTMESEVESVAAQQAGDKPGIYLADPRTADKEDLIDMEEPDLIDGIGEFSAHGTAAFVDALCAGAHRE